MAATIPFFHLGRIHGLIHCSLQGEPKYVLPEAEDFADGYKPLFIPNSTHGDVHQVGDYLDALALAALGLSALAADRTGMSEEQKAELAQLNGLIFIFPDDERAARASSVWVRRQRIERVLPSAPTQTQCDSEVLERSNCIHWSLLFSRGATSL